ncbi:MAG: glycoside hydrolase family 26 protein [Clostridiales bacterium]|nr:glycoside hydrolase family 26 protein [Clostridiales bacterium]
MKKAVWALAVLFVAAWGAAASSAYAEEPEGLYRLVNAGRYDQFTNYVDGYTMQVDKGMSVDMSYSSVCTVLENEEKRIEIYKQNVSSVGMSAYVSYSNRFLGNWMDHYLDFDGQQTIGSHNVHVTSWSRGKLSGIKNDKNYYVCLEIGSGSYVYTIFLKTNAPSYDIGGYSYLAENFWTMPLAMPAYTRRSNPVNVPGRRWNDETRAFYGEHFGNDVDLTWGIFEPGTALFEYNKLKEYEEQFDYEFPIILNYSEFQNTYKHPNLMQRLQTAYSNGKALELTLQTVDSGYGNQVYRILNGYYDEFLQDYAKVIADFGHPVLFRLCNEMNGDWCPYSAFNTSKDTVVFTEFYKYVYGFFEKAGANKNTIWVWNPNSVSYPNFKWNNELMYYPGDEYVDVVGMTAYNTGTYYSSVGERWKEFYELYNDMYYRYCADFGQPLMITEFSCASMGGNKEQWVINMFDDIDMYDRIKVAIWWDGCDWDEEGNIARSYFIDETPLLMDIFKRNLKGDWTRGVFG